MFSKILVGTTLRRAADPVVQAAAELASTYEAELVVLELEPLLDARNVFHPDGIPEEPTGVVPLDRRYPEVRVRSRRARGDAVTAVCEAAEQEAPDLIVVPRGGGRGDAFLSRRASSALVSRAACPVLLVAS